MLVFSFTFVPRKLIKEGLRKLYEFLFISIFFSSVIGIFFSFVLYIYADCANESTLHYSDAAEKPKSSAEWLCF